MGTETQCSFCGRSASILGAPVASCASCAATLGRWLGMMDESSRGRFWELEAPAESTAECTPETTNDPEAEEAFRRAGSGIPPEQCPHHPGRDLEIRLAALGFLAAALINRSNRSASLRVASVFLASCINESLLSDPLLKGAAQSCLEALFRPDFFRPQLLGTLRDEVLDAL